MGAYTVLEDPAVAPAIEKDLQMIATRLRDALGSNLVAVLITGGFGRGEGSVVLDPVTGPRPLNDYDMVLLTRGGFRPDAAFYRHGQELEQELGVMVDLGVFPVDDLPHREPTISLYEIREGHIVVWDDGSPYTFPDFDVSQIPLEQGTDLLFNRGMSLLRSTVARAEEWPGNSRRQCAIHVQKAAQAWGDAAILAAGRYHHRYRVRQGLIDELRDDELPPVDDLRQRYRDAVERKLRPHPDDPDPAAASELDRTVHDHEAVFRWFEEKRLGRPIESWREYARPGVARTERVQRFREWWRNPIRNLRLFGAATAWRTMFRPPRDRLIGVFPGVLFGTDAEAEALLRSVGIHEGGTAGRKRLLDRWH